MRYSARKMGEPRYILLAVHEDRADELLGALGKREYVKHIRLDVETRKALGDCPICDQRLAKGHLVTVTEEMVESMIDVLKAMQNAKAVVCINKQRPIDTISIHERSRVVEFNQRLLARAMALGLMHQTTDGSLVVYHLTELSIEFLTGKALLNPANLIVAAGKVLDSYDSMMIHEVKFRDIAHQEGILQTAKKLKKTLPKYVRDFIKGHQMSLI